MAENGYKMPRAGAKEVEINISPLMDMVFILLIFFIVTSTFTKETGVDVNKPKASSAESLAQNNIMIAITKEGTIHIHERQVDLPMLRSVLKRLVAENPERSAVIMADRGCETGITIDVLDECTMAGIKKASVATLKE
ncbi:MAG: ExbD/TolR family protein [Fibrobacterota bacterium]